MRLIKQTSRQLKLPILSLLQDEERNVGKLAELCNYTAANISRHLAVLSKHGLVSKDNRCTNLYYRIADESFYSLYDLVCGSILKQLTKIAVKKIICTNVRTG